MSEFSDNYYVRLSLPVDATPDEVREAYHDAARRLHPDTSTDPDATDHFIRVQEAYDVLSNPRRRRDYDLSMPSLDQSPGVDITLVQSQKSINRMSEPQLLYGLLKVQPTQDSSAQHILRTPLNLCVVLDKSTSMKGTRMDTVKAATQALIKQLQPEDFLSVVTFSDFADIVIPSSRNSDWNRMRSQIGYIQAGGGTELFQGLKFGVQEVSRYLRPSFRNNLILITDGHTYGDEERSLLMAEEAGSMGITISALGIGDEWNERFLDKLANQTGGSSMYLSSPKDIKRFLELKFNDLNRIYAENVRLSLKKNSEVEIKYAFRMSPDPGAIPLKKNLVLGNVMQQSELTVLIEFIVKDSLSLNEQLSIASGSIKVDIPSRIIPTTKVSLNLDVQLQDEGEIPSPPKPILQALSKLTLYRMQEQSRNDLAEGDVEQATRRLKNLATHLLSQGESDLASTVLLEVNRIERGKSITEKGGKEIQYGTRGLLLPPGKDGHF